MKQPIVKQLAAAFGGEWKAVRDGFGWRWEGPGRTVRAYSQLANAWDGDDSFMTVYIDDEGNTVGSQGMITTGRLV